MHQRSHGAGEGNYPGVEIDLSSFFLFESVPMKDTLIIATRGSDLALWQAHHVKSRLEEAGMPCELKIIRTKGDEIQHISLDKMEGKGFFTKEIEEALLKEDADIAVHSHKDLPTESPEGLMIAAISDREDPSEYLLIRKEAVDPGKKFSLKRNAIVGTSSARRKSQMLAFRNDIVLNDLRGNVPTRIKKLRDGIYDAILLAVAGVERLGLDIGDFHAEKLDPKEFIPSPAQGVLAIQIRKSDTELFEKLQLLNNPQTATLIAIERNVLSLFHGGCHMPVGAFATYDDEKEIYSLRAARSESWDRLPVSAYMESKNPELLADRVVEKIRTAKPCSVFISRNQKTDDYFVNALEGNGFHVTSASLIDTVAVPFQSFPETDWIFFASRNAVKFFFSQKPQMRNQKIGCIGKSTAEALRRFNHRADFIGYSTDTKLTGKQFAARAGNESVLFPQAKGSMRSVQQGFVKKDQVVDLVVYETVKADIQIIPANTFHILVFTSPSNAEAYLEKFNIQENQKVVAMGEATGHTLKKFGVTAISYTDAFDDTALARSVFSRSSEN